MTYDQKLEHVLRRATAVFAEKGYHRASIRDISRATGMSLAGLYYYFTSKQQLLFLIADHCHTGMLERGLAALEGATDPRDKLARLIRAHLEFALEDMDRIKVLSHEIGSLHGKYLSKVVEKRKRYFAALVSILRELRGNGGANGRELRTAAAGLFGMLNWIYTWYRPGRDPDAAALAGQMTRIFLDGFPSNGAAEGRVVKTVRSKGDGGRVALKVQQKRHAAA
jgi:TetR/AcrR family transcriptional regulator, cholesterol catabolism regulator